MCDAIPALVLALVLVAAFSLYGPREMSESRAESGWMMPGDGPGGTALAAPGTGNQIVVISGPEELPAETTKETECGDTTVETAPETAEEVTGMDLFLIGYAAGVAAVLVGMFAGPAAARLWEKIYNNT